MKFRQNGAQIKASLFRLQKQKSEILCFRLRYRESLVWWGGGGYVNHWRVGERSLIGWGCPHLSGRCCCCGIMDLGGGYRSSGSSGEWAPWCPLCSLHPWGRAVSPVEKLLRGKCVRGASFQLPSRHWFAPAWRLWLSCICCGRLLGGRDHTGTLSKSVSRAANLLVMP